MNYFEEYRWTKIVNAWEGLIGPADDVRKLSEGGGVDGETSQER